MNKRTMKTGMVIAIFLISMIASTCLSFGAANDEKVIKDAFYADGRNIEINELDKAEKEQYPDATAVITTYTYDDEWNRIEGDETYYIGKDCVVYGGGEKNSKIYDSVQITVYGGSVSKIVAGGQGGKNTYINSVQIMVYSGNIDVIQFADNGNIGSVQVDICDNGSELPVIGQIIAGSQEKNKGRVNSFSIQDYVENDEQSIKLVEGYYGDLKYTEASLQSEEDIYIYIQGNRFTGDFGKFEYLAGATVNGKVNAVFNAGEGAFSDGSSSKVIPVKVEDDEGNYNDLSSIEKPVREGYVFIGWGLDKNDTEIVDSIQNWNTFYAVWRTEDDSSLVQARVNYDLDYDGMNSSEVVYLDVRKGNNIIVNIPHNVVYGTVYLKVVCPDGTSQSIKSKLSSDKQSDKIDVEAVSKNGKKQTYSFDLRVEAKSDDPYDMIYWYKDKANDGYETGIDFSFTDGEADIYLPPDYEPSDGVRFSGHDTNGSYIDISSELTGDKTRVTYESSNNKTYYINFIIPQLSNAEKNIIKKSEKEIESKLNSLDDSYTIKIADPDELGISGWDKDRASYDVMRTDIFGLNTGLEMTLAPESEVFCILNARVYDPQTDPEMEFPIWDNMEPDKEYKVVFEYLCTYRFSHNGSNFTFFDTVTAKKTVDMKFTFVDVNTSEKQAEIQQLRSNASQDLQEYDLAYNDLLWLNVITTTGSELTSPIIKEAKTIIDNSDNKLYNKLTGDTELNIKIACGGRGDAGCFGTGTGGQMLYYVDDVLYWAGDYVWLLCDNKLYVPEGTADRAAAAEKRIEKYLKTEKDKDFVKVEAITPEETAEILRNRGAAFTEVPQEVKAAYLTDKGIAMYDHASKTGEDNFVSMYPVLDGSDITSNNNNLETLKKNIEFASDEYWNQINVWTNLKAYQAYKVTIGSEEYLYYIDTTGDSQKMKEPKAHWKHRKTGIITIGQNGFVPADAYTEIDVVDSGKEFNDILKDVDTDKDNVKAYDISAYTNFKGGKLEDLGNGRMQVWLPLGDYNEENLVVFYYSDKGIVKYSKEDYHIETDTDGNKYVVFETEHFSIYGLADSSVSEETPGEDTDILRLYGDTRYQTAIKAADQMKKELNIDKFENIIVATGNDFPDALPGSYLAAEWNAPILLINDKSAKEVCAYIGNNLAEDGNVYVLGGTSVVPDKWMQGITFERISGSDRFGTDLEILKKIPVEDGDTMMVCTGFEFADSLSASATGNPIMLVGANITAEQKEYLESIKGKCDFYMVGGKGAVSERVAAAFKEYDADGNIERADGNNRYETSTLVAEKFFDGKDPAGAVLAYARMFPDGLSGGPLAYTIGGPLILTDSGNVDKAKAYIGSEGIKKGFVLGGSGLISDAAVKTIFGE